MINTPTGSGARADGYEIRTAAVRHGIPCVTTMTGATAAARAIAAGKQGDAEVRCIQEIHGLRQGRAAAMTAPFGRRLCEVSGEPGLGRLPRLLPARPRGPRAAAGPVLHAGQRQPLGRRRASGPSCRGRSRSRETAPRPDGVRLDFLVEGVGPGTDRLCELEQGEGAWVTGPARQRFADPTPGQPEAAGAILVGGGIGVAPLALLRRR